MSAKLKLTVVCLLLTALVLSAAAVSAPSTSSARTIIKTAFNKTLKKTIVVDGLGRTLYMLTYDTKGIPTCEKADPACPQLWPALTSTGKPAAGKGINGSLLKIVRGAGGSRQVSYNRHPLYLYSSDTKPGEANGQAFYGLWYVLSPAGKPIK